MPLCKICMKSIFDGIYLLDYHNLIIAVVHGRDIRITINEKGQTNQNDINHDSYIQKHPNVMPFHVS